MHDSAYDSRLIHANPRRRVGVFAGLVLLLLLVCIARITIGESVPRDATGAIDWPSYEQYLWLRMDRMVVGLIVGAALAVSGAILQSLLRNPLASPYILGVSSGAALGVVVAWAGWLAFLGAVATHVAAVSGAGVTMLIVYLLAQRRGRIDPVGLLLIGVIINALNGAIIMFINYLNPHGLRSDMARWMMGYLDETADPRVLLMVGLVTLLGTLISASLGKAMDVATFSDSEARSMGLRLGRHRTLLFLVAGVLAAGAVMLAGPIGFVGLICPHVIRLLLGPAHRGVIVGSALAGAILVVSADTAIKLASLSMNIGLMPIGVLTALLGGPTFLLMLRRQLGGHAS